MTSLSNGVDASSARNFRKFRRVLCFFTWQKDKQLRPANRIRHPRAFSGNPHQLSLRLRLLARFGTLLLCAWPHQKPSQMFTSCLRFLCFFCFCFSVVDVDVVRASFITPYFMLVLAFCLLLSFRLWIVEKFFVIINFFFFWRVFWVLFSKAAFEKGCGLGLWRGSGQMQKWFWQQHHLALLFLINILISVYWFMLPTEMHDEKRIQLKMLI